MTDHEPCCPPDWTLLRLAPELASLSVLTCALRLALAALRSQHPALAWPSAPHDHETITLARQIDARCRQLLRAIETYHRATVAEIDSNTSRSSTQETHF